MSKPSTNGTNGTGDRGPAGRFAKGNPGGPGNPNAKRTAAIRQAILRAVKPADVREAIAKLIEQAKQGDRASLAEVLDRAIGKPAQADLMERLDRLETLLADLQSERKP